MSCTDDRQLSVTTKNYHLVTESKINLEIHYRVEDDTFAN